MAKLFQITLPDGMSELKLDSQGRATLQYNVANKSARPIDARAVLVPLGRRRCAARPDDIAVTSVYPGFAQQLEITATSWISS